MKILKIVGILLVVYAGIVVLFESLIGYFQPAGQGTLVITTTNDAGEASERVLSLLKSGEQLYVAANHWPREWYNQALANPNVQVTLDGEKGAYLAVSAVGEEHDRLSEEFALGMGARILMGFPPRYFVRLDPVSAPAR